MSGPLSGKRILITQASEFMGPTLCEALAAQGATVVASHESLAPPEAAARVVAEAGEIHILIANLALAAPTTWATEVDEPEWREAFATLRERFAQDRLGVTAGSLTFTTTIALVPMITVVLAVVTAFPVFHKFQDVTQKWLVESLVPDNIARQVLGYLTLFAGKANKLGLAGLVVLVLSVLSMIFTIDRTLNAIWITDCP